MELIREAPARDPLMAALHLAPPQPLRLQKVLLVLTQTAFLPQIRAPATPLFPAPSLHSLEMYLPAAVQRDSLQASFSKPSDPFTLADQPTIMLRSVSHPSARTRMTCGKTKRIRNHISQKCHTRAASYPPKAAANQWSCMGL